MDMFKLLKKRKRFRRIAIGVVIGVLVVLVLMPIFTKFYENTLSSDIISENAVKGTPLKEGGNNYQTIKDGSDEEKNILKTLTDEKLWTTEVSISKKQQLFWYKTLSEYLEKTYLQELKSYNRASDGVFSYLIKTYFTYSRCDRQYISDYANDECDFNGPVHNHHKVEELSGIDIENTENPDKPKYICDGVKIYDIGRIVKYDKTFYKSNDGPHDVGGKILGLFPDVLASTALANTYYTLDQNQNKNVSPQIEGYQKVIESGQTGGMPSSVFEIIKSAVETWFEGGEKSAVINRALDDTFDEGSIYATFDFSTDSYCEAIDVPGYYKVNELPCGLQINLKKSEFKAKYTDYDCIKMHSFYTDYEIHYNVDGTYSYCEPLNLTETDGNPATYYVSKTEQSGGGREYATKDGYKKYCDYVWTGGENNPPIDDGTCLHQHKGPYYQIRVNWICSPKKPIKGIKCTPQAVYDDLSRDSNAPKDRKGKILYYTCASVSEDLVRKVIVDPVFDDYENHKLGFNKYMTTKTVLQYICPEELKDDEDETCQQARAKVNAENSKDSNPMGYKIDEETRKIVAKHIAMEITGGVEGRLPVICDKEGNFALKSYNRVEIPKQYEDALRASLFIKDNIYRAKGELTEDNHYSEKIFGTFYSKYNEEFDNLSDADIEQMKRLDKSRINSLIIEIFSTYDYVTKYILEYGTGFTNYAGGAGGGTGLEVADACNYSVRKGMPYMGTKAFEEYYTIGLYGECAWYATGRAREILAAAGKDKNTWTDNVNGGSFCDTADANKFNISSIRDYDKPRKGAIISWTGGSSGYGHVAIIEEVVYNDDGSLAGAYISEGGLGIGGALASGYTRNDIWNSSDPADIHDQTKRKTACSNGSCFNYQFLTVDRLRKYGSSYNFRCYVYLLNENDQVDENGNCINSSKPNQKNEEEGSSEEPNPNPTYVEEETGQSYSAHKKIKKLSSCSGDEENINTASLSDNQKKIITDGIKEEFGLADSLISTYTMNNVVNTCKFYNFLILSEGGDKLNCDNVESSINSSAFEKENIDKTLESSNMASVSPGQYLGERGSKLCYQIGDKNYSLSLEVGNEVPKWIIYYEYADKYKNKKDTATRISLGKGLTWSTTQLQTLMRISWTTGLTSLQTGFVESFITSGYKGAWCYVMDILRSDNTIMANFFNVNEMTFDLFATGQYPQVNPEYGYGSRWKYYSPNLLREIVKKKEEDGRSFDDAMYKYIIDHYDKVGATNGYQTCPGYGE